MLTLDPATNAKIIFNLIIAATAFFAAWINLSQKKISRIGLDAFILFIVGLVDKQHVQKIREDPALIKRMGYAMLLFGVIATWTILAS